MQKVEEMFISVVKHNYRYDFISKEEHDRLLARIGKVSASKYEPFKRKAILISDLDEIGQITEGQGVKTKNLPF